MSLELWSAFDACQANFLVKLQRLFTGMRRFRSPEQAQRFLSAHAVVYNLFNLQRQLVSAAFYRLRRARAFECWSEAVSA
jgi:transposase-like protein